MPTGYLSDNKHKCVSNICIQCFQIQQLSVSCTKIDAKLYIKTTKGVDD